MILVGFTHHTSKIIPRIFCRRFRHCAVVVPAIGGAKPWIMHQFIRRECVAKIELNTRDMNLLRAHGWVFVYVDTPAYVGTGATCVQYAKSVCNIHRPCVQRPDALWRILRKA